MFRMVAAATCRHDPRRRALLRGRVRAEPALRPPWALEESGFVDACIGCQACVEACPEAVLSPGAGQLPVFDPARGECTFCARCVDACRDSAFRPAAERPWTLQAHIADRCLTHAGIVCASCRDACGEAAIRFPVTSAVPAPVVAADRCTGCGACVAGCPAGAITLQSAPLEAFADV